MRTQYRRSRAGCRSRFRSATESRRCGPGRGRHRRRERAISLVNLPLFSPRLAQGRNSNTNARSERVRLTPRGFLCRVGALIPYTTLAGLEFSLPRSQGRLSLIDPKVRSFSGPSSCATRALELPLGRQLYRLTLELRIEPSSLHLPPPISSSRLSKVADGEKTVQCGVQA